MSKQVISMIIDKRRSLDLYWHTKQEPIELMLMLPMTGPASFIALEKFWQSQVQEFFLAESLPRAGIVYAQRLLTEAPIIEQLEYMQQVL